MLSLPYFIKRIEYKLDTMYVKQFDFYGYNQGCHSPLKNPPQKYGEEGRRFINLEE